MGQNVFDLWLPFLCPLLNKVPGSSFMWACICWSDDTLLHSDCYDKIPYTGLLINKYFLSHTTTEAGKSTNKARVFPVFLMRAQCLVYMYSSWHPHEVERTGKLSGDLFYNLLCKGSLYGLIPFQQFLVLMSSVMLVIRFPQMILVDTSIKTIDWDGDKVWEIDIICVCVYTHTHTQSV